MRATVAAICSVNYLLPHSDMQMLQFYMSCRVFERRIAINFVALCLFFMRVHLPKTYDDYFCELLTWAYKNPPRIDRAQPVVIFTWKQGECQIYAKGKLCLCAIDKALSCSPSIGITTNHSRKLCASYLVCLESLQDLGLPTRTCCRKHAALLYREAQLQGDQKGWDKKGVLTEKTSRSPRIKALSTTMATTLIIPMTGVVTAEVLWMTKECTIL